MVIRKMEAEAAAGPGVVIAIDRESEEVKSRVAEMEAAMKS